MITIGTATTDSNAGSQILYDTENVYIFKSIAHALRMPHIIDSHKVSLNTQSLSLVSCTPYCFLRQLYYGVPKAFKVRKMSFPDFRFVRAVAFVKIFILHFEALLVAHLKTYFLFLT